MAGEEVILDAVEYQLVLVQPDSHKVLALDINGDYRLPLVRIPPWTRPAEQLRKACKTAWELDVLVLDFLPAQDASPRCAVVELLGPNVSNDIAPVAPEKIARCDLSELQRAHLASLLAGETSSRFCQVGWIDEAIAWLESATQRKLSSKSSIDQLNAGGGFSLVRFQMEDGSYYWLKATAGSNAHEFAITCFLSGLCGDYLPRLISSRPSWNAWLMSGEATCVAEPPTDTSKLLQFLEEAVESMAELQMRTAGRRPDLLQAGAFDQGMQVFRRRSEALFDYLAEAMSLQTSAKAPRLDRLRLQEIRTIFEDVCRRTEDLELPETIVHGDLNHGNVLTGSGGCQFIDWCEAYVGNPLITLQHLLLLNKATRPELSGFVERVLKQRYRDLWTKICDPVGFDTGFVFMPLLAIASSLIGRGDWLTSPKRNDPRRQSYARTLARYMDHAARDRELLEAVCG